MKKLVFTFSGIPGYLLSIVCEKVRELGSVVVEPHYTDERKNAGHIIVSSTFEEDLQTVKGFFTNHAGFSPNFTLAS